jgi:hypothetical protein
MYQELHRKHQANLARGDTGGWKADVYQDKETRVMKKSVGLLNKLNEKNFKTVSAQVHSLYITAPNMLGDVVNLIYDKAVADDAYRLFYTRLTVELSKLIGTSECVDKFLQRVKQDFADADQRRHQKQTTALVGVCYTEQLVPDTYIHEDVVRVLVEQHRVEDVCILLNTIRSGVRRLFTHDTWQTLVATCREHAPDTRIRFMIDDIVTSSRNCFSASRQQAPSQPPKSATPSHQRTENPWSCPRKSTEITRVPPTACPRKQGRRQAPSSAPRKPHHAAGAYDRKKRPSTTHEFKRTPPYEKGRDSPTSSRNLPRHGGHRRRSPPRRCQSKSNSSFSPKPVPRAKPTAKPISRTVVAPAHVVSATSSAAPLAKVVTGPPCDTKVRELVLEYLDTDDFEEALACWKELDMHSHQRLRQAMDTCMDQRPTCQPDITKLLQRLTKEGVLATADWNIALDDIAKDVDNIRMDCPRVDALVEEWRSHAVAN